MPMTLWKHRKEPKTREVLRSAQYDGRAFLFWRPALEAAASATTEAAA